MVTSAAAVSGAARLVYTSAVVVNNNNSNRMCVCVASQMPPCILDGVGCIILYPLFRVLVYDVGSCSSLDPNPTRVPTGYVVHYTSYFRHYGVHLDEK